MIRSIIKEWGSIMKKHEHYKNTTEKEYDELLKKAKVNNKKHIEEVLDTKLGYIVASEKGMSITGSREYALYLFSKIAKELVNVGCSTDDVAQSVAVGLSIAMMEK